MIISTMEELKLQLKDNYLTTIKEHQNKLPVPIIKLSNSFGMDVYKVSDMEKNISGALIYKNGKFNIFINKNDKEYRQRFTIAHEIAHFLLHSDIIKEELNGNLTDVTNNNNDARIMYRSNLYNIFEKQANQLAAEILMPIEKVIELEKTNQSIKEIANIFNVSIQAIEKRIQYLNNIYIS